MRFRSLADEFEHILEAFGSGAPEAMRKEVTKLRARIVEAEAQFIEAGKAVDEASYTLGAADVAAELLATTAERATSALILDELRANDIQLSALHQLALWTESSLGSDTLDEAGRQSQKALAEAIKVSPSAVSRSVLPRLHSAGLVRQSNRSSMRRAEITEAGLSALDQLRPGWRVRDARTNTPVGDMPTALAFAGDKLFEDAPESALPDTTAPLYGTAGMLMHIAAARSVSSIRDVYDIMFGEQLGTLRAEHASTFTNTPLTEHMRLAHEIGHRSAYEAFHVSINDAVPAVITARESLELVKSELEYMFKAGHPRRYIKKAAGFYPGAFQGPEFHWSQLGSKVKDDNEDMDAGHAQSA